MSRNKKPWERINYFFILPAPGRLAAVSMDFIVPVHISSSGASIPRSTPASGERLPQLGSQIRRLLHLKELAWGRYKLLLTHACKHRVLWARMPSICKPSSQELFLFLFLVGSLVPWLMASALVLGQPEHKFWLCLYSPLTPRKDSQLFQASHLWNGYNNTTN